MDDFLDNLWIEEMVIETPIIEQVKKKKKKNPSPEKLERRRLQMEFEEKCRIKKEEKKKNHENFIKWLHWDKPQKGYSSLILLWNGNYTQLIKKQVYEIYSKAFELWWEVVHLRPVENMTLAKNYWKHKNRKFKVAPWEYSLPKEVVDRILLLTK